MWKQNRNLVILVSVLILIVVSLTAYFLYKKWQTDQALEAGRIQRETVLHDLVNTPYENKTEKEVQVIQDSILEMGKKDKPLTSTERQEVIDTLLGAPKTIPNE